MGEKKRTPAREVVEGRKRRPADAPAEELGAEAAPALQTTPPAADNLTPPRLSTEPYPTTAEPPRVAELLGAAEAEADELARESPRSLGLALVAARREARAHSAAADRWRGDCAQAYAEKGEVTLQLERARQELLLLRAAKVPGRVAELERDLAGARQELADAREELAALRTPADVARAEAQARLDAEAENALRAELARARQSGDSLADELVSERRARSAAEERARAFETECNALRELVADFATLRRILRKLAR